MHPTHSVAAIGPLAMELVSGHEYCSTPCGAGSPYDKIMRQHGQILFLGVDLDSNTSFHAIEGIANLRYLMKLKLDTFNIIDSEGESKTVTIRMHEVGIERRFNYWENILVGNGILRRAVIGKAQCLLLEGKLFLDFMLDQVARDPNALVPHPL